MSPKCSLRLGRDSLTGGPARALSLLLSIPVEFLRSCRRLVVVAGESEIMWLCMCFESDGVRQPPRTVSSSEDWFMESWVATRRRPVSPELGHCRGYWQAPMTAPAVQVLPARPLPRSSPSDLPRHHRAPSSAIPSRAVTLAVFAHCLDDDAVAVGRRCGSPLCVSPAFV